MKAIERQIETYIGDNGYRIDVESIGNEKHLWLYKKDLGIKVYMFKVSAGEDVEEAILYNAEDYISDYRDKYEG